MVIGELNIAGLLVSCCGIFYKVWTAGENGFTGQIV